MLRIMIIIMVMIMIMIIIIIIIIIINLPFTGPFIIQQVTSRKRILTSYHIKPKELYM